MRVLIVAKTFRRGGAASGARNLASSLNSVGIEVIEIDAEQSSSFLNNISRLAERVFERIFFGRETHCLKFSPATVSLRSLIKEYSPDIIQLCDVSGNTISFKEIPMISCPVVHRMSDFWPYNGADHYSLNKDERKIRNFLLRKLVFNDSYTPPYRVAPSHWLANNLKGDDITVIRNFVQAPAGLPSRKVSSPVRLGFIAGNIWDERKGLKNFLYTLKSVDTKNLNIDINIYGKSSPSDLNKLSEITDFKFNMLGEFSKDQLSDVYQSFDILVCPSTLDNSPNVVTEALAHGVPVICQSYTGMDSYISPDFGALMDFTSPDGPHSFLQQINRILSNYEVMSNNAYRYSTTMLSGKKIGGDYMELYERAISSAESVM